MDEPPLEFSITQDRHGLDRPSGSRRLQIEAEARTIGRSHVDALRTSRDVVLFLESLVYFFGSTWPGDEHLAPRGILVGEDEVSGTSVRSPWGMTGIFLARASASIQRSSVNPPHHCMSGCQISAASNFASNSNP